MTSIVRVDGATGVVWYSWPVGTPQVALDGVSQSMTDNPSARDAVRDSITSWDGHLSASGATIGGMWAPPSPSGTAVSPWSVRVLRAPEQEEFRSARRYERLVKDREFDGTSIVYYQKLVSFFSDQDEAILTVESRCGHDGKPPYLLARAVYFPTWTKDRVVLESVCLTYADIEDFVSGIIVIASTIHLHPDDA